MPRRPSAIAAVMSRSLSSMARSLGNAPPHPCGRTGRTPLKRRPVQAVDVPEDACLLPGSRARPHRTLRRAASGGLGMTSKRLQALVLATAVVAGYAGAAAFSAWGLPAVPIATDFGPDDGLTRYVLTATSGAASDDLLAELERTDGVVNAQRLSDGRAFVATKGLAPQHLEALPGIADAEFSTTVPVFGTVTDPYFPGYGYNLDNTGSNAYGQYAIADADVDAPEGWDGGTGAGAIVAVVDTGYDSDHP